MTALAQLSLFEALCPARGYRTTAALGTAYSVDLVAAAAVLAALDGQQRDAETLGRVSVIRAIHRIGSAVRIAHHPGKTVCPEVRHSAVLPLLDRIVLPTTNLPGGPEALFHPKVWLARQENAPDGRIRHVFVVGSRNLTLGSSWELGACLVADDASDGSVPLPRLATFIDDVCRAMSESEFGQRFPGLSDLRWRLPDGVETLRFGYQTGASRAELWDELESDVQRLTVLSPFLSPETVQLAAARWKDAEHRLLVGGRPALNTAAKRAATDLRWFNPRVMPIESGEPAPAPATLSGDTDPEQADEERGLHAKLIALVSHDRTQVLIGSSNFTTAAWGGANFEANVLLELPGVQFFDQLKAWTDGHTADFKPAETSDGDLSDVQSRVESLQRHIAAHRFVLDERGSGTAKLQLADESEPDWQKHIAIREHATELSVARLSTPEATRIWPDGAHQVLLPECGLAERTRFLEFRLRSGDQAAVQWIQSVAVLPDLHEERDKRLIARLLGPQGFIRLLQGLILDHVDDDDDASDPSSRAAGIKGRGATSSVDMFSLEALLRFLAREPERISELQEVLDRYEQATAEFSGADGKAFADLQGTLRTISAGIALS